MTLYAGEEIRISATAEDFDNSTALVNTDIANMKVTIYDSTGTAVVTAATMTYDNTNGFWYYLWDTTGQTTGSFKAKVVLTDLLGKSNWEWKRIRLARDLV